MDTLLESFPNPDFIKMDIEGAEYMAMQGARKVINDVRPIFYMEVGHEVSQNVFEIFQRANYHAFDPQGNPIAASTAFNVFFIPVEKVSLYQKRQKAVAGTVHHHLYDASDANYTHV